MTSCAYRRAYTRTRQSAKHLSSARHPPNSSNASTPSRTRYIFPKARLFANAVPVLQSSLTGKSRMLTEVSSHPYPLVWNLRSLSCQLIHPSKATPSDHAVRAYFNGVETYYNRFSISAHHAHGILQHTSRCASHLQNRPHKQRFGEAL
jgi:hypothetical protein